MKTHEHALISLGYAAGVALMAGKGVADPWIYVAAVVGGEIIDFIDHPLYHLVYRRNEPHVKEARKILREKGTKAAATYLNEVEDDRQFKGLLLHNIYFLILVAFLSVVLCLFLHASVYWFVGLGAFFLHMLTDIYGDFRILGNADNWLWVLSKKVKSLLGKLGKNLVIFVLVMGTLILMSFFILGFRWGWQLGHPNAVRGLLADQVLMNWNMFSYIPILLLSAYFLMIFSLAIGQVHKYKIELNALHEKRAVPFSLGSLKLLVSFLFGKLPKNRDSLERVLLRMQADAGFWAIVLAGFISLILLVITGIAGHPASWNPYWQVAFLMIPVFFALLFGTFIHTTVGEVGGVLGVLLAWVVNLFLSRVGLMEAWKLQLGYELFIAAMVAWILGLAGGMILKGQSRLSLIAFSIQVKRKKDRVGDLSWLNNILVLVSQGLQTGYRDMHAELFEKDEKKQFVITPVTDIMLTPYQGRPIIGEDYCHIQAKDSYSPIFREIGYVLCDNRLSDEYHSLSNNGFLPVMPRQRFIQEGNQFNDMGWDGKTYSWKSKRRPLQLKVAHEDESANELGNQRLALRKTWSEFLDNTLTRKSTIQTDIFVYPESDDNVVTICGFTRELTSTKEYATVEAEAYTGAVIDRICSSCSDIKGVKIQRSASGRFFYPHVSFFDQDLTLWASQQAVLPTDESGFPKQDLVFIKKSLDSIPVKNLLPAVTANLKSRFTVLIAQYMVAGVIGLFNIDPVFASVITDAVKTIVK
ncbi:MAG: hypothetical protein WCE68_18330 [Anaerolineales bacterium]